MKLREIIDGWKAEGRISADDHRTAVSLLADAQCVRCDAKTIPLPCPFCGVAMVECNDEDGHYWVHAGRIGIQRADCWLADAWISDEATGEGSLGEWNTRAACPLTEGSQ